MGGKSLIRYITGGNGTKRRKTTLQVPTKNGQEMRDDYEFNRNRRYFNWGSLTYYRGVCSLDTEQFGKCAPGNGKTMEHLPDQLDDLFRETGTALNQTNQTISEVNDKLHTLSPLFYMVRDVGEASRKLTSPLARFSSSVDKMGNHEAQDD